jgi:threonine synthase
VILYKDTRALGPERHRYSDVVIKGIARGGGLFVPETLPRLSIDQIVRLAGLRYAERAAVVHRAFGIDVPSPRLEELLDLAFGANFDHPAVAPVVEVTPGLHLLELWHGPTSAFKDMALQCMPIFFSESIAMHRSEGRTESDYLVLVATSGDTGKAALEGFADRPSTRIVVFYPAEGVSDIQRKQMVTQHGSNVCVFGVRGNFDDCQNAVKAVFNNESFNAELLERRGLRLSSANSINWGRLLPQIVYYVSAYADMVGAEAVAPGSPIDVCVPTGNFGNILAAMYARRVGVPIGRLLCASNENNVLTDFIASGTYDISSRAFVTTPSPSMDILISSNLERALHVWSGDPSRIRSWMAGLSADKRFTVDPDTLAALREEMEGDFITNEESLATIKRVFDTTGYLMDPHTSVAWEVAERLRGTAPVLVASTAHWAKFGADVYKALRAVPYASPLPPEARDLTGVQLLGEVTRMAPGSSIPRNLADLDTLPERFTTVVDRGAGGAEGALRDWLGL